MPQDEYEVKCPRSNATIRRSAGPRRRRAWEAADMPAPLPPMTTSLSGRPAPDSWSATPRPYRHALLGGERNRGVANHAARIAGGLGAGGVVQHPWGQPVVPGPADRATQREHPARVAYAD